MIAADIVNCNVIGTLATYTRDFLHLFFPDHCQGCGSDVVEESQLLCLQCLAALPATGFFDVAENPVEKTFYGRLSVETAGAAFYFTKDSLVQHLITELKYHGNKEIGHSLGKLTGEAIKKSPRLGCFDCIVPLPLNAKKLQKRGYNQAAVIAEGIASVIGRPVLQNAVERKVFTETQTQKDRIHRWQHMQEAFTVKDADELKNKHVLLVDDIITTGATAEACGAVILGIPGIKLSIASVAWTI